MQTKVSLARCEAYDAALVKKTLRQAVTDIGGFSSFLSSGERVLLKVNLLMKKKPEYAVTTHPIFVQALAELLVEFGCKVVIGDSPGGPFSERLLKGLYRTTGMEDAAEGSGAALNYNVGACEKENPSGLMLKRITVGDMLNDVDKVISVAKLKTHGMMTFSGAVKNMFGIVPGAIKLEYHMNMPEYEDFANAMLDICLCGAPAMSFIDAIDGMEGNGPSSGEVRRVGAILASGSPYHLDKVACALIGVPQERVPTITMSVARGLCEQGLADTQVCGEELESFSIEPFKTPEKGVFSMKGLPLVLSSFVNNTLQPRPVFQYDTCIGCGVCADNCPARVLTMQKNKPVVDLSHCIRCYCCLEMCPKKSVNIHRPLLLKLLTKN